jgi:UDP-2,3-diacylglucosamine pyrophosphatase LpxH
MEEAVSANQATLAHLRPASLAPLETYRVPPRYAARLEGARRQALPLTIDRQTRLIVFGDCHRADGGPADIFRFNHALFRHALAFYFDAGFNYIENGDGDDVWVSPRFETIREAYADIFDLLHRYAQQDRLQVIVGNHDVPTARSTVQKDGLPLCAAIRLAHPPSDRSLLVLHGHQADDANGHAARLLFRALMRPYQRRLRAVPLYPQPDSVGRLTGRGHQIIRRSLLRTCAMLERRLAGWARQEGQLLLCGHTHAPHFPTPASPFYANGGSCLLDGQITGYELVADQLRLVRWTGEGGRQLVTSAPLARLLAGRGR